MIRAELDVIFPGHTINCEATIEDLSIAERQMVEIAINFARSAVKPRLVILDEPTSSLDAALAGQLMAYIRRYVASGGSVILISHILGEILSTSDRVVVMKDGKVVADRPTSGFTTHTLVEAMGNVVNETIWHEKKSASTAKTVLSAPAHVKTGIAHFPPARARSSGLRVSAATARPKPSSISMRHSPATGCRQVATTSPSWRVIAASTARSSAGASSKT